LVNGFSTHNVSLTDLSLQPKYKANDPILQQKFLAFLGIQKRICYPTKFA